MTKRIVLNDFPNIMAKIKHDKLSGRLSSTAFTDKRNKIKYIDASSALFVSGEWLTAGEVVCDWLRELGVRRHPAKRLQAENFILRPPLLARTGRSGGNYAYYDIKSAYHSIYSRLRWQDELTEKYHARGITPLADFPYENHKLARNAVVGIARGGKTTIIEDGYVVDRVETSGFQNLHLCNIINHVLHYVAKIALGMGAVYINTDGYILPDGSGQELAAQMLDHGLIIRRKSSIGTAEVWGVGRYRVGDTQSSTDNRAFRRYDYILPHNERALRLLDW